MAFDIEKLSQISQPRSEAAIERAKARKENREWLRMSQEIALRLHYYLRNAGMTQKDLADKMGVSAVYIGKLLKGGENLTLETICKIQKVTGQEFVSVTRPYSTQMIVSLSSIGTFSANAIKSDKFSNRQTAQNSYVMVAGGVA